MTTIVSNGDYLIADKRTTTSMGAKQHREDASSKIHHRIKATYASKEVSAYAFSGNVQVFQRMNRVIEKTKCFDALIEVGQCLNLAGEATIGMLLLYKEGGCVRIVFNSRRNGKDASEVSSFGNVVITECPRGSYLGIGSGWHRFVHSSVYMVATPTVLDAFLFGAYLDDGSSTDYDVFGREENALISRNVPSEEEVKTTMARVEAGMRMYTGPQAALQRSRSQGALLYPGRVNAMQISSVTYTAVELVQQSLLRGSSNARKSRRNHAPFQNG